MLFTVSRMEYEKLRKAAVAVVNVANDDSTWRDEWRGELMVAIEGLEKCLREVPGECPGCENIQLQKSLKHLDE